jgi:hypothetical protein
VFSESIGMLFKAVVQHLIGTEIEEGAGHTFLGEKSPYSPYGPAQKSRAIPQKILGTFFKVLAHFSRHFFLLVFIQSWQNFGHKFRDSPYNINCWDNRTVVWISGSEIEEQSYRNVQISLCKFLKMNML